ncbi:MAG: hypothetical protein M3Y42_01075 [Actinomycetota bacterium]|nr:hypothetical protein [Actinomycetota bacterium]MDQ2955541.1 hypothetical protein [Actinomycetota bacterium]
MTGLELSWSPRAEPLPAAAVVATGATAIELGRVVAAGPADQLTAAGGDGWLLVLGPGSELPWVDGARYLGWQTGLLLPTTLTCTPPVSLIRTVLPDAPLRVLLPEALLLSELPRRPVDVGRLA